MDELLDSEVQFSEWTDSLDDEWMDIEQPLNQDNLQVNTVNSSDKDTGRNAVDKGPQQRTSRFLGQDCDGKMFQVKDNSVLPGFCGVIDRVTQSQSLNEPIIHLFGFKFAAGSALVCKTDTLFYLLRQQIFRIVNMQSEQGIVPLSSEMNVKCIGIRKECSHFMDYLHTFINSCFITPSDIINLPDSHYIKSIAHMPDIILRQLEGLSLFLGRLTSLPIASLIRTDAMFSASHPSATFHLFHLYLDLIWNIIQALWEILHKQDQENRSREVDDVVLSIKNTMVALLWDLTALAAASFNKVSRSDVLKSSPFPCPCVCEVWVSLLQTLDHLSAQYDVEPFWSLMSSILQQVIRPDESTSQNNDEDTMSDVRCSFTCNDPVSLCWWLVSKVAPLYWFNDSGVYSARRKASKPGNWVFVTEILKSSLTDLKGGQEEVHRRFYLKCCLAVSSHWAANNGIVVWLWDYFHKRMNDLYNIPSHTLHGITTVSLTATQWMQQCKDRCEDKYSSLDQENSFSLLLRIIAVHLNKIFQSGSQQGWKQMKGRFYSKFTKRRMEELNENGMKHFLSLFLTLSYVAADLEDVATKMCHFLDFLDFTSEHPGKKITIMKGLFTLMLIYKERRVDFAYLSSKMSTMFGSICKEYSETQTRDKPHHRHVWDMIVVYIDSTQEILEHRNRQDLSQNRLLESQGFKWLFECCRDNELRHLLTFVQAVLVLAQPSPDGRDVSNTQDVTGYLWTYLFPHLQKLLSRDRTIMTSLSANLADTMAGFTLLALQRYPVPISGSVSFKGLMMDYGVNDEMTASFSCRFLCHVITARDAVLVLQSESLQNHVIRTWFRCLLQLPPPHDGCSTLSRAVAKLPEMVSLTDKQAGFGLSDNSETTLKQFIMSVSSHNQTLTTFEEMIHFRKRAQTYIGDVEKYIDGFVSTGKPQNSLRLAFAVCGLLFKHCYKIIYSMSVPLCLLPKLLDQLIVPLHTSNIPPVVQHYAKMYLHWFLEGLSHLDFRKDEFIRRKLRKIFDTYFPTLCQKSRASQPGSVAVKNPFLVVLKGSLEQEPTQESSDFRHFCMDYISDEFFKLPQHPQLLSAKLHFIDQLFKKTQSHKETARDTLSLLPAILCCLLACETSPPGNEPPDIRRQATDILRMMIESCQGDHKFRDALSPPLKGFVFNNLEKCQGQVFKTLQPLTVLDPDLLTALIPDLKQSVMQSERRRGVGVDSQLRGALRDLLKHIGRENEADL